MKKNRIPKWNKLINRGLQLIIDKYYLKNFSELEELFKGKDDSLMYIHYYYPLLKNILKFYEVD